MPNKFGTVLNPGGRVVSQAVDTSGATSPGATALKGIADGLNTFVASRDAAARRKRQAAAEARAERAEQRAIDAANEKRKQKFSIGETTFRLAQINAGREGARGPTLVADPSVALGRDLSDVEKVFGAGKTEGNLSEEEQKLFADGRSFAAKVQMIDTAVQQGSLPPISKDAAIENLFDQMVNKYGIENSQLISKVFRDEGVEAGFLNDMKKEIDDRESIENAQRAERADAYSIGTKNLEPELIAGFDEEVLINHGRSIRAAEETLDRALKQADLNGKIQDQKQKEHDFNKEIEGDKLFKVGYETFTAHLAPYIEAVMKAGEGLGEAGTAPGLEKRYAEIVQKMKVRAPIIMENIIGQMVADGATEADVAAVRKQFEASFEATFVQPLETRYTQYKPALQLMEDKLGLNAVEAFPVLAQMRQMGLNPSSIPALVNALDPEDLKDVIKEIRGIGTGSIQSNAGKIRLNQIISLMKGNETLENYSPQDAAKAVGSLYKVTTTLGSQIKNGNFESSDEFMNSLSTVVTATNTLNRSSGFSSNINAAAAITGRANDNRKAIENLMNNPATAEEATSLGIASRAGAAKIAINLKSILPSFEENGWGINLKNGVYSPVKRGKTRFVSTGVLGVEKRGPPDKPPTRVANAAVFANNTIRYLVDTSEWDGNAPKGTPSELTKFYAEGKSTPAMRKQQEAARKQTKGGEAGVRQALNALDEQLDDDGINFTPTHSPSSGNSRGERNNNPGNLEASKFTRSQPGYVGSDGRFGQFDTMENGIKAQETLLSKAYIAKGHNTPNKVIWRYGNDPGTGDDKAVRNYVKYVAKRLGIGVDDKISSSQVSRLAQAMREFETGNTV